MMIIGCDFHPSWQQVSWLDTETGETGEQKLVHATGDAKQFYEQLASPVLIGMEATGNSQWFIEWVQELGHEIWIGDAAQIRASYVRKQKTDKRDADHIRKLVVEGRFPKLWTPDREQRDLRQLVLHRHKLVEIRSRVKNELQHLSMNKGMQRKAKLWSQAGQKLLRELPLQPWAACRREDLLGLLAMLDQQVGKLDGAVQRAAEEHPQARLLMTQPGVGPNTALAYVLTIGDVGRFQRGKQVASYLGLIPREESSGGRQKLGAITKQGNRLVRSWWKRRKSPCALIPDYASSICIAAIKSRKVWPRWRRHASWPYDSTGCCARMWDIQRSFASRAARGWPWSAQARPQS